MQVAAKECMNTQAGFFLLKECSSHRKDTLEWQGIRDVLVAKGSDDEPTTTNSRFGKKEERKEGIIVTSGLERIALLS
jgi:hypothetical protein